MPRVPYSPVPDVSPQFSPAPQIRVSTPPAAFGENIAQQIQHLGTTEEQVGGELAQRALAMQQLRNETAANDALASHELQARQLQVDYRSKMGFNAVDGWDAYQKAQNDLRQSQRDSLDNPAAQRMFDAASRRIMNTELGIGADHAATQLRQARHNSLQATIDTQQAVAAGASQGRLEGEILPRIQAAVEAGADMDGASPDVVSARTFREQSKARARNIEETARTNPVQANLLLDKARTEGKIHSLDLPTLENIVHSNLDRTATRSFVNGALNEIKNPEGFFTSRGAPRERGVDPDFGQRMVAAITKAEEVTGQRAKIESLVRTTDEQAKLYADYKAGKIGLAAPPGSSRHELGRAADIPDGPILDWLHKHAGEYGLEFLPGWKGEEGKNAFAKDPGHIQLADAKPLRELPAYSISERQFVDLARTKAMNSGVTQPEILDRIESGAMTEWRRQKNMDDVEMQRNVGMVLQAFDRPNPPQTMEELLKTGPDVTAAWENLPWKTKDQVRRMVEKDPITDLAERDRLRGMANNPDQIGQFTSPEMHDYILNNSKLSRADKKALLDLQQQRKVKAQADDNISLAMGQVKHLFTPEELADHDKMNLFRGMLQTTMQQYHQTHGTQIKGQELQEMAQRLYNTIRIEAPTRRIWGIKAPPTTIGGREFPGWQMGFRGAAVPLYQQSPSSADYNRLKEDFVKRRGFEPSDRMISEMYVGELFQKLYGNK